MKTIYKYMIELDDPEIMVSLPVGAKVIHVGVQYSGEVHFWVELTPSSPDYENRTFRIYGTGHPIPDGHTHQGTVLDRQFVWHLYEVQT